MPDIHPTAEQVAERVFLLLWDTVSDPVIRKDALFKFVCGLVEKQRGEAVTARVTFVLRALARGVALSGSTDWRAVLWQSVDAVCGPRPVPRSNREQIIEEAFGDSLGNLFKGRP